MTAGHDRSVSWTGTGELAELHQLAATFREAQGSAKPVTVDLTVAPAPSAALVQLLIAAGRAGDVLQLRDPSRAFVDGCGRLGLYAALMALPMEPPS